MTWVPEPGAAPEKRSVRKKPKTNNAFPGTKITLVVDQVYVKHRKWESPGEVLGVPLPEIPTDETKMRAVGPSIRTRADIHMDPSAVKSMEDNEQLFYKIVSKITGEPASIFFDLGHALYQYGIDNARNKKDGSLDIKVSPTGAKANGQLIAMSPPACIALIQAI
ncbi:MAG: hypothetical protein EPO51_21115 [Phenylobacterium sp.]|uniref:hypothetical protein n=1 Tax=Phenylobacterium sp. TaxID=1871053 RepID=UPI0011FB1573|nr:hypothetical protein [Phenylobacterium sp.]TAJ70022.1 MAG: hypothetical protein EPO51_21115 [Phenylobacterium sp.]